MTLKPVLLVQHARHEHPAALRRALETQGIPTLWIHPYRGDPYPELNSISGLVSLGGPMSANDEAGHPWIREEIRLIQGALTRGMPVLGICLGGQLLTRSLGYTVSPNPNLEVGWFPLTLTSEGLKDRYLGGRIKPTVYHFHFDTFELPIGAEKLASSEACSNQAYRMEEKAYGLQFHPEADHQLLGEWLSLDGFEKEIEELRILHGDRWVQDAKRQVELAHQVELDSIQLIIGFSLLFREKRAFIKGSLSRSSSRPSIHSQVELWELLKVPVQAEFESGSGGRSMIRGVIERTFSVGELEFILLRGEDWLVWPIALSDLLGLTPVSK